MLTFEKPPLSIDGLTVYHDHEAPEKFYYLAPEPRLARSSGVTMFDLYGYTSELRHSALSGTTIPEELGAGFLNMGVECVLSAARETRLRDALAADAGRPADQIQLGPVPYHKGSIEIIALDHMSSPAAPPASPASADRLNGRPTFVESSVAAATPSLLDNLRAIFSLRLSQQGFEFLQRLYEQRAAPVGVVYQLKFYGLSPLLDVEIVANLSRVFTHFGGGLGVQYEWFRAEVNAGLDYLRERGDIKIAMTSQRSGGDNDPQVARSKELAMSIFRDRIAAEMFRPLPAQPPAAGANPFSTAVVSLSLDVSRRYDDKETRYTFSERAPEERVHAPQAFLPMLMSQAEFARRLHMVNLGDGFFEQLDVLVTGPTRKEFSDLRIREVEAAITYGQPGDRVAPKTEAILFRPDSTGDKTFAAPRAGRKTLAYTYSLSYRFEDDPAVDAEATRMDFTDILSTRRTLPINPTADFGVLLVELRVGRIDPSISRVDVDLAYAAPDTAFRATQQFRLELGPAAPPPGPMRWQVRTRSRNLAPFTVAYTFVFADGSVFKTAPAARTEPLLYVDSPFQAPRTLLIRPNIAAPTTITRVTVEVEYEDAAAQYARRFETNIDAPFNSVSLSWPILEASRSKIRYRVTTQELGASVTGEWSDPIDDPSIVVGGRGARRVVQVRLIGPTLADAGLDALIVKVRRAANSNPDETVELLFEPAGVRAQDATLFVEPAVAFAFEYQTTAIKTTGEIVESAWRPGTSNPLPVSTRLS